MKCLDEIINCQNENREKRFSTNNISYNNVGIHNNMSCNMQNDYEFKKLITSTINTCYPKIKSNNDSDDILNNMERLSQIVITGENESVKKEEGDSSNNSLYDDVDNILNIRNKIYIETRERNLLSEKKKKTYSLDTSGKINTLTKNDNKEKYNITVNNNKNINENIGINHVQYDDQNNSRNFMNKSSLMSNEKLQFLKQYEERLSRNDKYLYEYGYYLNKHMIEINDNINRLSNNNSDYAQRNVCTKNIINLIPSLHNIYENKNLCYIKDCPNFSEVAKIIPQWKYSFEALNTRAHEDTRDMKNILKRIENMKKRFGYITQRFKRR